METGIEECFNCGRVIGRLESAFLWRDRVVCRECHLRLSGQPQKCLPSSENSLTPGAESPDRPASPSGLPPAPPGSGARTRGLHVVGGHPHGSRRPSEIKPRGAGDGVESGAILGPRTGRPARLSSRKRALVIAICLLAGIPQVCCLASFLFSAEHNPFAALDVILATGLKAVSLEKTLPMTMTVEEFKAELSGIGNGFGFVHKGAFFEHFGSPMSEEYVGLNSHMDLNEEHIYRYRLSDGVIFLQVVEVGHRPMGRLQPEEYLYIRVLREMRSAEQDANVPPKVKGDPGIPTIR